MSLANYEDVDSRIHKFYEKNPSGKILTHLEHVERAATGAPVQYIVRAEVYTDTLISTGYAEEIVGTSKVNETSALENCETSAIGRALANAGYSPKGARPSLQEMQKVERVTPVAPDPNDPWLTPVDNVRPAAALVEEMLGGIVTKADVPNGRLGRENNSLGTASDKQKNYVEKLMKGGAFPEVVDTDSLITAVNGLLTMANRGEITAISDLSKTQASYIIEVVKGSG